MRAFPSYSAAKRALGSRPGQELHHIVEQCQAKPERSGLPVERVNTTDNFVWLPVPVHRRISAHYSQHLPGTNHRVRDALTGTGWERQYRYGERAVSRELRNDNEEGSP